jgi:predicted transcriptional regulator
LKRRPSTVIYMEILALLLDEPEGPSRLTQALGLNYNKFLEFANYLESKQFIRKELREEHELYFVTAEGAELYRTWDAFRKKFGLDTDLR